MHRFLCAVLISFSFLLAADGKVLIWETSAKGLPGKAFVAGSIHSGKASWYPLDEAYDRALDASSSVYFEIFRPDNQEIARKTLFYGVFRDGKTLSQILGYPDFQAVSVFIRKINPALEPAVLERLRPWMLSIQISNIYLMQHPEISRACGLESVFTRHLGSRKGESLESVDSQLRAMSNVPDAAAGRLLMEGIRDFESAGRDLKRIFHALETGVPDELSLITNEMAFKHPQFHSILFLKRNERIAEKIYEMLKQKQTVFILVGAGHLAGQGNILELLRNRGCTTIQLKRLGKPGRLKP